MTCVEFIVLNHLDYGMVDGPRGSACLHTHTHTHTHTHSPPISIRADLAFAPHKAEKISVDGLAAFRLHTHMFVQTKNGYYKNRDMHTHTHTHTHAYTHAY